MSRPAPSALAMTAVIGLAALVAATSHTSVWARARQGTAPLIDLLAIVVGALLISSLVVGIATFALRRHQQPEISLRGRALQALPAAVVGTVLLSLVVISRVELRSYRLPDVELDYEESTGGREGRRLEMNWGTAHRRGGVEQGADQAGVDRPDELAVLLWMIVLVGLAGSAALAKIWWTRRAAAADPGMPEAQRRAARSAILNTIDAMLADPDPKTAIIGAYARLLEDLSANGAPRKEYEGPVEHLHRVLTVLKVRTEPLERLIGLFEEARFSTHSLTIWHRDQALDALHEVAADLGVPSVSTAAGRST